MGRSAMRGGMAALLAVLIFVPATIRPAPSAAARRAPGPPKLSLVGALRLEPFGQDVHADVAVAGNLAFVGKWRGPCPGSGVDVVDVSDPTAPVRLGHTPEHPDTSMEVMRPIRIGAREVLAIGLQDCGGNPSPGIGQAGLELVDVTDPRAPAELSFFDVDAFGARVVGVHELDVTRAEGGRSLALLAAPGLEAATAGPAGRDGKGDLLIVDISDPVHPVLAGSWGVLGDPALGPGVYQSVQRGNDARTLLHSVRASANGARAYLSYWDAGVVLLDIRDPARPRYLGRTTFPPADEGNAHSVAEAPGGHVIVEADEVLTPFELLLTSSAFAGTEPAAASTFSPRPGPAQPLSGEVAYAVRGCPGDPLTNDLSGRVALVQRGGCRFDQKAADVQRAGATGLIVFDDPAEPDDLGPMGGDRHVVLPDGAVDITIPAVRVRQEVGERLRAAGATVSVASTFAGWGGIRLWDVRDPAHPVLAGRFATLDASDPAAVARGLFSVHNPEVRGSLLYASWYSDGIRVIDVSRPSRPHEIAAWTGQARPPGAPPVSIWGVAVRGDLVLASDRSFGLYVLRLSG